MLYVQQSLSSDEDIIYTPDFTGFYDVQAVMAIVWGLFLVYRCWSDGNSHQLFA